MWSRNKAKVMWRPDVPKRWTTMSWIWRGDGIRLATSMITPISISRWRRRKSARRKISWRVPSIWCLRTSRFIRSVCLSVSSRFRVLILRALSCPLSGMKVRVVSICATAGIILRWAIIWTWPWPVKSIRKVPGDCRLVLLIGNGISFRAVSMPPIWLPVWATRGFPIIACLRTSSWIGHTRRTRRQIRTGLSRRVWTLRPAVMTVITWTASILARKGLRMRTRIPKGPVSV